MRTALSSSWLCGSFFSVKWSRHSWKVTWTPPKQPKQQTSRDLRCTSDFFGEAFGGWQKLHFIGWPGWDVSGIDIVNGSCLEFPGINHLLNTMDNFCIFCNATQMCRASRIHAFRNFCGSWRFLECDAIKSRLLFLSSHWPSPPAWHKSFDADNSRTEHQTFYLLKTARGAVSKNAKAEVMGYCHTSYGKKVIFTYS